VPQRLRAFVTYQRGRRSKRRQQIRVDIRWPRPSEPGGIVTAYHVFMTSDLSQEAWNQTSLTGEQLTNKYSLPDVPKNMVLYFKAGTLSLYWNCFNSMLLFFSTKCLRVFNFTMHQDPLCLWFVLSNIHIRAYGSCKDLFTLIFLCVCVLALE